MAWVRTATSLMSFGFTLYKFFDELHKTAGRSQQLLTPRIVGMLMIFFGMISLLLAQIQHTAAIRRLKRDYPRIQVSLSSVLSTVMLLFGLGLFLAALFRQ
jgi:putative membrane protein